MIIAVKMNLSSALLVSAVLCLTHGQKFPEEACPVRARTTAGWVCGSSRYDIKGGVYASFQNVPYAQQPLGELRFKELQPPKPWDGLYDATRQGPICPQFDILFGALMTNTNMSEACIHANIYVPMHALPMNNYACNSPGLPILIHIHGGGFVSGTGDLDVHGPEYLAAENIIVITFHYRLNSLGFLSLNSPSIPGNNGLRDCVTLLRWVKANARFFGGNPDEITISGHSSGAATAHLLVLTKAAEGLFKRAIMISGIATRSFYSASPKFAKQVANTFLAKLGVNETDPEEIHRLLIDMPLDKILAATVQVQAEISPLSFGPVVEQHFPGVTTVLDEEPETLLLKGQGNNIPLLVGFTNLEGEFFIPSYIQFNIVGAIDKYPLIMSSPDLVFKSPDKIALRNAIQTRDIYFNGVPTPQKFADFFRDYSFVYPASFLARVKAVIGGAPMFLYRFSYNPDFSPVKESKNVEYNGATHGDDLAFIFRFNAMKGIERFEHPTYKDQKMREMMVRIVKNFIYCNTPTCERQSFWSPQTYGTPARYANILGPDNIVYSDFTSYEQDMIRYFDNLYNEIKYL